MKICDGVRAIDIEIKKWNGGDQYKKLCEAFDEWLREQNIADDAMFYYQGCDYQGGNDLFIGVKTSEEFEALARELKAEEDAEC